MSNGSACLGDVSEHFRYAILGNLKRDGCYSVNCIYYTGLFKMTFGVQLSSGNSEPNSGNNHQKVVCTVSRDRVHVYPGIESKNQNSH